MTELSNVHATSDRNILKRSSFVGTDTVTLGAINSFVSKAIDHNLGYIPFIQVGVDFDNDGTIWSTDKIDKYTETSLSGVFSPEPTLNYWTTTNRLTVGLINNTNPTKTGTRRVWWVVYLDYKDTP